MGDLKKFEVRYNEHSVGYEEVPSHTQLLLENEAVPTINPIRARLVTDGEMIVVQVKTPTYSFYQPVARLEVKKGKLVMYREKRHIVDSFINTDKQGRIQN